MSWGFFLDLDLTLPTAEWKRLQAITGSALPPRWWGFEESDLDERFGGVSFFDAMAFKKAFTFFHDGKSCVKRVEEAKGRTSVRLTAHLDRSGDTQVAKPIAALFDAAAKVGGAGHIRLVNDGSYSGESGVAVTLARGELVRERERLAELGELTEQLAFAIDPSLEATIAQYASPEANAHRAAKTKSASKKAPTKKAAAKKKAPTKTASKETVRTKDAPAKKGAAKKKAPTKTAASGTAQKKQKRQPLG